MMLQGNMTVWNNIPWRNKTSTVLVAKNKTFIHYMQCNKTLMYFICKGLYPSIFSCLYIKVLYKGNIVIRYNNITCFIKNMYFSNLFRTWWLDNDHWSGRCFSESNFSTFFSIYIQPHNNYSGSYTVLHYTLHQCSHLHIWHYLLCGRCNFILCQVR